MLLASRITIRDQGTNDYLTQNREHGSFHIPDWLVITRLMITCLMIDWITICDLSEFFPVSAWKMGKLTRDYVNMLTCEHAYMRTCEHAENHLRAPVCLLCDLSETRYYYSISISDLPPSSTLHLLLHNSATCSNLPCGYLLRQTSCKPPVNCILWA